MRAIFSPPSVTETSRTTPVDMSCMTASSLIVYPVKNRAPAREIEVEEEACARDDARGHVANEGAAQAPFRGSMGGRRLNRPVVGMVPYGDGYLMVASDGGIFNFSRSPFHGSLGSSPPPRPVVAVAPLNEG